MIVNKRGRFWVVCIIGILFVVIIGVIVYFFIKPTRIHVQVSTVKRITIQNTIFSSGYIKPLQRQVIMATQLVNPNFSYEVQVGETVRVGQVLIQYPQGTVQGPSSITSKIVGQVIEENADGVTSDGTTAPILETVGKAKYIVAQVSEVDAVQLHAGLPVSFSTEAFPGKSWTGHISRVAVYAVQNSSGTGQVEVDITPSQTIPIPLDYQVEIHIVSATHNKTMVVPYDALVAKGNAYTVFVYANKLVRQVPVTIGIASDTAVEIVQGLNVGETIVDNPPATLTDGASVMVG